MSLLCRMIGHARPAGRPIWNDGHFFGACPRCGVDIISKGTGARWTDIPPGYRVSWRDRTEFDISW